MLAPVMRGIGARFVYVLESDRDPDRHYTGVTRDVDTHLEWHNHGPSGDTVNHRPWSQTGGGRDDCLKTVPPLGRIAVAIDNLRVYCL
jgi:hypothetical protein